MMEPCSLGASRRGRLSLVVLAALAGALSWTSPGARAADSTDQELALAASELETASRQVEGARSAAAIARQQLDAFVVEHFSEYRASPPTAPTAPPEIVAPPKPKTSATYERLNNQLQQLITRREELLINFTESHPEVLFVKRRIAEISRRLAALPGAETHDADAPPPPVAAALPTDPQAAQRAAAEQLRHEQISEQYERLFDRWQNAERELAVALEAESAAAERWAAIRSRPVAIRSRPVAAEEPAMIVTAPAAAEHPSQRWALVGLTIALAVASLAAIRLARSSAGEAVFASVDEVAAALALPVVGVIPAAKSGGPGGRGGSGLGRGTVILGEILLALVVFGLVAAAVQNPGLFWQFLSDPSEGLRGARQIFGQ